MTEDRSPPEQEPEAHRFLELLAARPTEADCQRCLTQLDAYVLAQIEGRHYTALFPDTAAHLDTCLECAHAYALLYEVRLAEANDALATPANIPAPDLSFLQPNLFNLLRRQLLVTTDEIRLQLTDALLPWLQPPPQVAPVRSAPGRYTEVILSLSPEQAPDLDLPFTLTAYQDSQAASLCLVEVLASPPGVSWPDLGNYHVTITFGETRLSQNTDDWGTAVFPDIPRDQLPHLTITIHPPTKTNPAQ